jgi:hypothetical protein
VAGECSSSEERTATPFVCVKEDKVPVRKRDASLAVAVRPGALRPRRSITPGQNKSSLPRFLSPSPARALSSFSAPDAAERDVYGGRTRAPWRRIRWPAPRRARAGRLVCSVARAASIASDVRTTASACVARPVVARGPRNGSFALL